MAKKLDIVWNTDLIYSLKSSAREGCGGGKQVKMTSKTPGHLYWRPFLRTVSNKGDVFDILAGNLVYLAIPGVKLCHRFVESMSSPLYQWIYKCNVSLKSASSRLQNGLHAHHAFR